MKQKITFTLLGVSFGFSLGVAVSNMLFNPLHASIEEFILSNVAKTNVNLAYAKSLRRGEIGEIVEHFESLIEMNASAFSEGGNGLHSLSENDLCVFNKVREYWENECNKKCFPSLKPIFERTEESITTACNTKSEVSGHS